MKNKKGFTLVELLVVITIIGIITVLALPGVQQLQERNRDKKFKSYSDALKSGGKLFTDSYADDMFGMQGNGCYDISFAELSGKSLIKDFKTDGISCDNDRTFVQVKRVNGKYSYKVSLLCKKGNDIVYESEPIVKCEDDCVANPESCIPQSEIPMVNVTWTNIESWDNVWSTSKEVTITVSAKSGLIDNINILYGWSNNPSVKPTTMIPYNYRNSYGDASASYTFTDDSGKNGNWYLFVEADDVIDEGGHVALDYWSSPMKFDNTPPIKPQLTNPKNNIWTGLNYVDSDSYVIAVKSSDTHSGVAYYQYCFPGTGNICGNEYDDPDWTTYANSTTNNFTTTPFKAQRDEDVYIRACDRANVCSAPESNRIKIDREPPTCSVSKSGTKGNENWYKENAVNLSLSTNDTGGSGVNKYGLTSSTSTTYNNKTSDKQGDTTDSGLKWYGYVQDLGGNTNKCETENFRVDITKPTKPVLTITGDRTLHVVMKTTESLSGFKHFERRKANTSDAFEVWSGSTNPYEIDTDIVLELRAEDRAGNKSESAYTKHCNISGGKLVYKDSAPISPGASDGWYCEKDTILVDSTCSSTCSGLAFENYPCWWCDTGYAGAGNYCTRSYHVEYPCTVACKVTGCPSGFKLNSGKTKCYKAADGG